MINNCVNDATPCARYLARLVLMVAMIATLPISWALGQTTGLRDASKRLVVFESGQNGYNTYRIPALAATPRGTLLAFCEGRKNNRSDSGDIDLVLRRSRNGGKTWGPMQIVVDDAENTCGNPCPIVDRKTGAVTLLITKNKGADNEDRIMKGEAAARSVWVTSSHDEGATWSTPKDISAQVRKPNWRWYATGTGHGIQLRDGRFVAPCDHSTGVGGSEMYSHVIFSDDMGETWRIGGGENAYTDESTVAELADGQLYLNMRNSRHTHQRAIARSDDRGVSWSGVVEDASLPEPVCQASCLAVRMRDKRNAVLFSNPASERRENMTVRLSYDGCRTWPVSKTLWSGPAAYSDLAMTSTRTAACLFECGNNGPYESITFVRFRLTWLTEDYTKAPRK